MDVMQLDCSGDANIETEGGGIMVHSLDGNANLFSMGAWGRTAQPGCFVRQPLGAFHSAWVRALQGATRPVPLVPACRHSLPSYQTVDHVAASTWLMFLCLAACW